MRWRSNAVSLTQHTPYVVEGRAVVKIGPDCSHSDSTTAMKTS